jgi:predicted phosphodiesterase
VKIDYDWTSAADFRCWGPYLSYGERASSEMRVSWQSKFYSLERWLDYGETPACGNKIHEHIEPSATHCVILSDLKPNTTYYYKISRPEDINAPSPPIYSFRTGPPEGSTQSFDFCVTSDMHVENGNGMEAFASMMKNVPNFPFLVTAGDCVTHGCQEPMWNQFFYELRPFNSKFVLMNTTGNHDTDHPESYAHFVQTFHHPYVNRKNGAYYHFIYGNALFIMLDSTNAGQTTATQGVISDEQMEWLSETLEEYSKKNYWIFIFMHHQMYSTGDSGSMKWYEIAYKDMFDEAHVDGVFFGHDHLFEVYWTERDSDWGGTHYYLVGNGGGDLGLQALDAKSNPLPHYLWKGRTYIPERDGILDGNPSGIRNDELIKKSYVYGVIEHGFSHFRISGEACEVKMIGRQNQVYFHDKYQRTNCGKKYHTPLLRREY